MEVLKTDNISPVKRARSTSVEDVTPPAKKMKLDNNEHIAIAAHNQQIFNNTTTPSVETNITPKEQPVPTSNISSTTPISSSNTDAMDQDPTPTPTSAPIPTSSPTTNNNSAVNTIKSLQKRKKELEKKLAVVNKKLEDVNSAIEAKINAKNLQARAKEEAIKKATPPKPKPKQKKSTTPKRPQRKKKRSSTLRDDNMASVTLSPILESCKSLLTSIARHKFAFPFMEPVDPVALRIPDYFKVIKYPMDFGTIKKKLLAGEYKDLSDFNADAQLVFSNACTYNHPGSDVYIMAETFRDFYNKKFKPLEERDKKLKIKQEGGLKEVAQNVTSLQQEVKQIKTKKTPPVKRRSTTPTKPKLPPEQIPMTKTEMKKLSAAINSLPYNHLNTIIIIIRQSMPNLSGDGEIEIDLHSLDTITLRKLESFVNSVKKKKTKKKEQLSLDAQRELARRSQEGTEKEIEAVQRQIEELRDPNHPPKRPQKKESETPKPLPTAPVPIQTPVSLSSNDVTMGEQSESDSCSESDSSSDSSSDSDSESDTESDPTNTSSTI